MGEGYTISYLNYAVFLWILSGILILLIDVRGFQLAGMNKERKVSKFIGWLSIIIGLLVFFVNTVLQ
ncbi:hypothetical protein MRBLPE1_003701 [Paenibacillus sp. LPE1-1-1.1]